MLAATSSTILALFTSLLFFTFSTFSAVPFIFLHVARAICKEEGLRNFVTVKESQENPVDKVFPVSIQEKSEESWILNHLQMLTTALTTLWTAHVNHSFIFNCKNLTKIPATAKIISCMKYQRDFVINYSLYAPYNWHHLERNKFNHYIGFSGKVVWRISIKLKTCCVASIHSNNQFLLKHSPCLLWSAALNFYISLQCVGVICSAS